MTQLQAADIHKIIVACDAGMGSSVMLAGQMRKELRKFPVTVEHAPVAQIPADADLVVCHAGLAERARAAAAGKPVVAFQIFLGDPVIKKILTGIKEGGVIDV
ncbi:MAG TPA: PTS lactose transporter subunit IIB [Actinocrinis sp.]|jgi:mannitol-specific phosphotransferase system IIBC component